MTYYTAISEDGFCYIPSVTIMDEHPYSGTKIELDFNDITRAKIASLLSSRGVYIEHGSISEAARMASAIYKKLPRYRRQLNFEINRPTTPRIEMLGMTLGGAGCVLEEVADKYL